MTDILEGPLPEPGAVNPPPVLRYQVFNASKVLVASYSHQGGAEGHVASWPALYWVDTGVPPQPPVPFSGGSPGTPSDTTATSAHSTEAEAESSPRRRSR